MHLRDFTQQSVAAFVRGIQRLNFGSFVLFLLAASLPQCQGGGMFEVQFLYYTNPGQRDAQNRCCSGGTDLQGSCTSSCRTFFTACVQSQTGTPGCVFGQASSEVLGNSSFVIPSSSLLQGSLMSWPVSFSLVVSAMHRQGVNSSVLIEKAIDSHDYLPPSAQWRNVTHDGSIANISFSYRFVCQANYYGSTCLRLCTPRDDSYGHYTCDSSGNRVCLPGWSGLYCGTAVCRAGCDHLNGWCRKPNECNCANGWQGQNCTRCKPHPNCLHGTCYNQSWECNCDPGWGGKYCNLDLEYCARNEPCKNGASCKNIRGSYVCICAKGYTGTNCETEINECSSNPCFNGGNCTDLVGDFDCTCPKGYGGKQCYPECLPSTCQNGGTCVNGIRGYFCTCKAGFTGSSCEQALATSPASDVTGDSSTHPANTKERTTNGTTVERATIPPSKNQTTGESYKNTGSDVTSRITMIVAIVVSVVFVLILIAACVAWKFWRKRRREAAGHVTAGAVQSPQARNPKQIDIEDPDPKHCAGARSGNPEIIRNFTSSKQPEKNTNKKQEHLGDEKKLKDISIQENARISLELSDITTTTTTSTSTTRKTTRMNLDELYLPNRCYDQGFWQEVELEI